MMGFGIPNGSVIGVENDHMDEPDVSRENPFGNGVEEGNGGEEPLEPSSTSEGGFTVESDEEEEEEELVVVRPVTVLDDDPSEVEEPEQPGSIDDLDSVDIINGEEFLDVGLGLVDDEVEVEIPDFPDSHVVFGEDDSVYSDLDVDDSSDETFLSLDEDEDVFGDDEGWSLKRRKLS